MFHTYLLQLRKKLRHALADYFRVAADVHKVRVAVPSRNDMNVQMVRKTRTRASAEIHPDIESVWF